MRVTIIPADRWIRRDNDAASLPEWPFDDASIHAIQWYGTEGEIEHVGPPPHNESIADPAILDPYLSALDAHMQAEAEKAATEARKAAAAATPAENQALEQILDAGL